MNDDLPNKAMSIENRSDFAQWVIERSRAIVAEQGGNLALAARDMSDDKIAETANALGVLRYLGGDLPGAVIVRGVRIFLSKNQ